MILDTSEMEKVASPDRDALIEIIMRETTDSVLEDGWRNLGNPNVLVQGCQYIRGAARGYEKPREAAAMFAGFIADAILAEFAPLLTERRAMVEALEWRPIETAPQDGTIFLAAYDAPHGPRVGPMRWDVTERDHKQRRFFSYAMLTESGRATHWMPLPAPPVDAALTSGSSQRGGSSSAESAACGLSASTEPQVQHSDGEAT